MKPLTKASSLGMQPSLDRLRCIVVESGATALPPPSDGFDETIVVAQMAGEPPASFARRVMARVARFERPRRHFESLSLLTGNRHDWPSIAARKLIVLGLAAHARAQGGMPELLLKAPPQASPNARAALCGLIEEVMGTSTDPSVPVRLLFDGESPQSRAQRSGIFRALTAPDGHQVNRDIA